MSRLLEQSHDATSPIIAAGTIVNLATTAYSLKKIDIPYLNHQKMDMVIEYYLANGKMLTPHEITKQERFYQSFKINRKVAMGRQSLDKSLEELTPSESSMILNKFEREKFMCLPKKPSILSKIFPMLNNNDNKIEVYYSKGASNEEVILGYMFALKLQKIMKKEKQYKTAIERTFKELNKDEQNEFIGKLYEAGWKTDYVYVPYKKYQYKMD